MRNQFKKTFRLLGVLFVLLTISCENDSISETENHEHSHGKAPNEISLSSFRKETGKLGFAESNLQLGQNLVAPEKDFLNDFVIDTTGIKKFQHENGKATYSFEIHLKKGQQKNELYNLVFRKAGSNWKEYVVYFLKNPKDSEKVFSKIELFYDSTKTEGALSFGSLNVCFSQSSYVSCDGICKPPICDGYTMNCRTCSVTVVEFVECSGAGSSVDKMYPADNSGGVFSEGGGGGGNGSDSTVSFYNNLSRQQQQWADANLDIYNQIKQYLNKNLWSSESTLFANELISQMAQNPGLSLDVDASFKSPFNIDRSAIDKNTPEGAKFGMVYESLMTSPTFKKLFIDLFGNNDRFCVDFKIAPIASGANGTTTAIKSNPELNTIVISPTYLKNTNKIEIAKTIIHECIHAYLNVKLCDSGQGMSIATLNNLDFFNVVNLEYNGFNGDQAQHNFIYNYMLPTMKTILSDVKDRLVSMVDDQNIKNTVIYPNAPNLTQKVGFDWNDCYYNLALSGLQDCSFFQNEIGVFNADGTINRIINVVKMNNFNQYKNLRYGNLH